MDTRVLTESDVHWIVEIFSKSGDLVLNRNRLCLTLGLTVSQLEDVNISVGRDRLQTHGFLTLSLSKWINVKGTGATIGKLIQVLRNQEFNSVADDISKELPNREGIFSDEMVHTFDPSSVWFKVPEEVSTFVGRQSEMKIIHDSVKGQSTKKTGQTEITVITTLSGLGGIGKTTLAIHYAWKYFQNKFYFNVIWINAETAVTIEKSFHRLADEIELITKGTLTLAELASKIYKHFEPTITLFVFDNVEQHEHIKPYLPIKSPKTTRQYVLITSRNRVWNHKTDLITLDVFPEKDSVEFLTSYLKLETDVEIQLAKEIARELQNLPLAIRQASAYIEYVRAYDFLSAEQAMILYLDLFRTDSKRVLGFECEGYERTINSTWKITLDKIKGQNSLAVRIMEIISYFNPDNIPIRLLQNIPETHHSYYNENVSESCVSEAVKLLYQFSMVKRDSQFIISVHRLVQKVIRDDFDNASRDKTLDTVIRTVETALFVTNSGDYEQNCLLHAITVLTKYLASEHYRLIYSSFINFVNSKRNNSMDAHIQRLIVLLDESKYDEAEELFYTSRDKFSGLNGVDNALTKSLATRFINCVCEKIEKLITNMTDMTAECELLRLIELCRKFMVGLPLGESEHLRDFEKNAFMLHSANFNTHCSHNIRRRLVETAVQLYAILLDHFKTTRQYSDTCCNLDYVIRCFSYLERWTDLLKMVEAFYELSIILSNTGNEHLFHNVSAVCHGIYEITREMNQETYRDVQNKIFEIILNIYSTIYTYFQKGKDYKLALECGLGRIKCLTHLNRPKDILDVIGDIKLVVGLPKPAGIYDGAYQLFRITLECIAYSSHSTCKDIKTAVLEFVVVSLKIILKNRIPNRAYDFITLETVISLLKCLTQLNRISEIGKIGKDIIYFLGTISAKELGEEFRDFNNSVSKIENDLNCTNEVFNLFEFTLQIYRLIVKIEMNLKRDFLIGIAMGGILNCLAELNSRQEIIILANDLKTFLVTADKNRCYGHFTISLDSMFEMSKYPGCQDIRIDLLKTLLQSYELLYRSNHIDSLFPYVTNIGIGILNCLAELNKTQTILETVNDIMCNVINHPSMKLILYITNFFESLFIISKHSHLTSVKTDLLEIGLANYKLSYDFCKNSRQHSDILNCMEGMLNYLIELNQKPLFIQYVCEEFQPFLVTLPEWQKSEYENVIQKIDKILESDLIRGNIPERLRGSGVDQHRCYLI